MKIRAMLLLICCVAAAGLFSAFGETSLDDKARLEKLQKARMAGKSYRLKPVKEVEATPSLIDIGSLKKINPKTISTMQIYRVEWIDLKPVKKRLSIAFGEDSRREIDALMGLIKQAPKAVRSDFGDEIRGDPDRALVVRLATGSAVEIHFSSHLDDPFAGLKSRKLKEALYGLSCNSNSIAIMRVNKDKAIDVRLTRAQSVQRSGVRSSRYFTLSLKLAADGSLILNLKVKGSSRKEILVDGKKTIQYGGAVVFDTLIGDDMFIAYLLEPVFQ